MFNVKLSAFERRFVGKVLRADPRLLETIRRYPRLEVYWQDLLERYRGSLLAEAEEQVSAVDTRRGHVRPVLAGPRSAA